ncbi:TlpA family protein disulfide reductase [bacterium]|nr:TlpA family protein disulfide reductase [bacterium]
MIRLIATLLMLVVLLMGTNAMAKPAPEFELDDLEGDSYSLDDLVDEHEVVLIDFWEVGCIPCNKLLVYLNEYYDELKDDGLGMYIISRDTSLTESGVEPFFKTNKYPWKVLRDGDQEVSKDYGVKASPATFLIVDGEIVYQHYGYSNGQEKEIYEAIKGALAGEDLGDLEED